MCDCETKDGTCQNEDCVAKDVDVSTLEGWASKVEVEDAVDVLKLISTAYQDLRAHLDSFDQAIREGFYNNQIELRSLAIALLDKGLLEEKDLTEAEEKFKENMIKARDQLMEQMKQMNSQEEETNE